MTHVLAKPPGGIGHSFSIVIIPILKPQKWQCGLCVQRDDRKWCYWFLSPPLQKAAAVSVALRRELNDAVRQDQCGSQSSEWRGNDFEIKEYNFCS